MKKVILSLAVLFLSLGSTLAFSQDFRFGVKGGLNYNQTPDVNQFFSASAKSGYHIGPMVEFSLPILPVSIDAALLFSTAPVNIEGVGDVWENVMTTNYIELPVNLKVDVFSLPAMQVMVVAGPSFSYVINNNIKAISGGDAKIENLDAKKISVGLNAGLGVEILGTVQITATYNATFGDSYKFRSIAESAQDFIKVNNKGFRLSAALLF